MKQDIMVYKVIRVGKLGGSQFRGGEGGGVIMVLFGMQTVCVKYF